MSSRLRRWWLLLALILATTMVARTGWLLDQAKIGTLSNGKLAFGLATLGLMGATEALIFSRWWRPRWLLLIQVVGTFAPYVVLGTGWGPIGGLLAAGLLLTLPAPVSWPLFGAVVLSDAAVSGALSDEKFLVFLNGVIVDVNVGVSLFSIVYLIRRLEQVHRERERLAALAVATERMTMAARLRLAVGADLSAITRLIRENMARPSQRGLERVAELSRRALAAARSTADTHRAVPRVEIRDEPTPIYPWLALVFLVVLMVNYVSIAVVNLARADVVGHPRFLPMLLLMAAAAALQLYHGTPRTGGATPRFWPMTLTVHAVVVGAAIALPTWPVIFSLAPFSLIAGAIVLLIRAPWSWITVGAMAVSVAVWVVPEGWSVGFRIYWFAAPFAAAIVIYALCGIPQVTALLTETREAATRTAVMAERLRVARDLHDLLGQGLSAITLKAELAARRLETDRAAALKELNEAAEWADRTLAEVRSIASRPVELSLAEEVEAALDVLRSAGIEVTTDVADTADADVLAIVLREAVTNIVRHSRADSVTVEITTVEGLVRLRVVNNGVAAKAAPAEPREGTGLANLTARVTEAGGQFTTERRDETFTLLASVSR